MKYYVTRSDNRTDVIEASNMHVADGVLLFVTTNDNTIRAYARDGWLRVELASQ